MSPLKLIKEGILKNNLTLILDGYNALTGENLAVKKAKLKRVVVEEVIESEEQQEVEPQESSGSPRPMQRRQLELHKFKNKFTDDGKAFAHNSWDKKYKIEKVTERRPPAKKYDITCDKCKKTFKVYAKYLPPRFDKDDQSGYVCNSCVGKGK